MWLLIAFIAVPLIEIGLFIQVGGLIGLFPTLAIVLITAIAGTYLLRQQGLGTLARLRNSMQYGEDPTGHLIHGAMIVFAGALLLTPGFFTDAVGLSLMIPQVRQMLFDAARARFVTVSMSSGMQGHRPPPPQDDVIDGEFEEVRERKPEDKASSGWTKH